MTDHPGGIDVLLECAGTDGTETYDYAGHSGSAQVTLGRYYVGDLEGHVPSDGAAAGKGSSTVTAPSTSAAKSTAGNFSLASIPKPAIGLVLAVLTGALLAKIWPLVGGSLGGLGAPGSLNVTVAFWGGVLLASSLAAVGLGYLSVQFNKTFQHTKEPFAYPALIPRPVHIT